MIVGIAVETTVDSKEARAVTSIRAAVTTAAAAGRNGRRGGHSTRVARGGVKIASAWS